MVTGRKQITLSEEWKQIPPSAGVLKQKRDMKGPPEHSRKVNETCSRAIDNLHKN